MNIKEVIKKNGTKVYRSNVYLGVDSITGKKVKTTVTGRTKKEVKVKAQQTQIDFKLNGSTIQKAVTVKNFQELADIWLESYKLTVKPQTYEATLSNLRTHIYPVFGNRQLDKITASDIQVFINQLSRYFENFVTIRSIIRRIFQQGILLQLVTNNPARDIILPRRQKKADNKVKFIAPDDLKAFLDNLEKKQYKRYGLYYEYVLYHLLLSTGLRIGEACALEWTDIDLDKSTITVNKTYNKGLKAVSTAKTKSANRTISIDNKTILMLKQYRNRQRQLFFETGARAPSVVFATPTREYFDLAIRQSALDTRCKEVGIHRFTFHAFRHTHASLLLNAGISYKELQYRLGHSNITMTLDIYSHLSRDKEKEAVVYFEKAISSL
ncbi:tyrosine-type recombinase/integrase [Streptococcus anginosus]|uniref:tyrosine-type recombinase/integrase n=1 Tax=Streptococcus anginosus TaxID=1328 RepID=UPI001245EB50|nr:site-specific integrase [Streptococcus anginosus]KAA9305727.1 site-specific integrase [Streptococcus anginosus]KAB0647057.1 site-specific integrase [Aerococcus sanguinicola]